MAGEDYKLAGGSIPIRTEGVAQAQEEIAATGRAVETELTPAIDSIPVSTEKASTSMRSLGSSLLGVKQIISTVGASIAAFSYLLKSAIDSINNYASASTDAQKATQKLVDSMRGIGGEKLFSALHKDLNDALDKLEDVNARAGNIFKAIPDFLGGEGKRLIALIDELRAAESASIKQLEAERRKERKESLEAEYRLTGYLLDEGKRQQLKAIEDARKQEDILEEEAAVKRANRLQKEEEDRLDRQIDYFNYTLEREGELLAVRLANEEKVAKAREQAIGRLRDQTNSLFDAGQTSANIERMVQLLEQVARQRGGG